MIDALLKKACERCDEICTYEVAKLAKEKRFNCKVTHYYQASKHYCETLRGVELHSINWRLETDGYPNRYNRSSDDVVSAPTQSLLQRWLREEKGDTYFGRIRVGRGC